MSHTPFLLLSPTQFELTTIVAYLRGRNLEGNCVRLCGFGPVAAAARTSLLIAQNRPKSVLLAGIAGSLDAQCLVGEAYEFHRVRSYGIGVGEGQQFRSAEELGWKHVHEEANTFPFCIGDVIPRDNEIEDQETQSELKGELLSVCAASSSQSEAGIKKKHYPDALAEDMEGFAVAAACEMHSIPWVIVRGISNRAGDRNKDNWQIDRALQKAAEQVDRILADE